MTGRRLPGTPVLVEIDGFSAVSDLVQPSMLVLVEIRHALTKRRGTLFRLGPYESDWVYACFQQKRPALVRHDNIRWFNDGDVPGEYLDYGPNGMSRTTTIDDHGIIRTRWDSRQH